MCASLLASCAYDPNANTATNAATFWNSHAFQATLTALEARAATLLTGLLANVGAARAGSTSVADRAYAQLQSENPNVPEAVLRGAVAKELKAKQ